MKPVPRMGLLLATLALPLGAVLASLLLGEEQVPPAPASVQIGESRPGSVGQPSTPPSPTAARPLVVGERATPTSSTPRPNLPTGPAMSDPAAPAETPAPDDADPADPNDASSKGKAKGRNNGVVPSHSPPSHAATPGNNGSGG